MRTMLNLMLALLGVAMALGVAVGALPVVLMLPALGILGGTAGNHLDSRMWARKLPDTQKHKERGDVWNVAERRWVVPEHDTQEPWEKRTRMLARNYLARSYSDPCASLDFILAVGEVDNVSDEVKHAEAEIFGAVGEALERQRELQHKRADEDMELLRPGRFDLAKRKSELERLYEKSTPTGYIMLKTDGADRTAKWIEDNGLTPSETRSIIGFPPAMIVDSLDKVL